MLPDPRQIQLQAKEKTYESLTQKYMGIETQISNTRDADDKIALKDKQAQIEQEMNSVYEEIQQLKAQLEQGSASQERKEYNLWESRICKIDYKKANETFNKVLKKLEDSGGHVLFLIQKSASMGGTWCIQELRERLSNMRGEMTEPREFSFSSYERADTQKIMNLLAAFYLKEDFLGQKKQITTKNLIQEIEKSLFSGAILYFQVNIKCSLEEDNLFLHWFIQDFWCSLTESISPTKRNRLVAVISVDESIPPSCLPSNAFSTKGPDSRRVLELPLKKWTEAEISNWLIDCSSLDRPPMNLPEEAMLKIAASIYRKSKGQPTTVYNCLKEELEHIKAEQLKQHRRRVG
jgi:hypothetical protein